MTMRKRGGADGAQQQSAADQGVDEEKKTDRGSSLNAAEFMAQKARELLTGGGTSAQTQPCNANDNVYEDFVFRPFAAAFKAFDAVFQKSGTINVAIDGGCGSGKTTLANALRIIYGGNVIHMDDYFLPKDRQVIDGLTGYDAARFADEAVRLIDERNSVVLRRFDCQTQTLSAGIETAPSAVNIVEGAYSFDTARYVRYDLKIFLAPSFELQKSRIIQRSSLQVFEAFEKKWISKENAYFLRRRARENADVVVLLK